MEGAEDKHRKTLTLGGRTLRTIRNSLAHDAVQTEVNSGEVNQVLKHKLNYKLVDKLRRIDNLITSLQSSVRD